MSITTRIETIKHEYIVWFDKAKKSFPKSNTGIQPVVSTELRIDLDKILSDLNPVLDRLKDKNKDRLINILEHSIEQQHYFRYEINTTGDVDFLEYPEILHKDFLSVLSECYDYFARSKHQ